MQEILRNKLFPFLYRTTRLEFSQLFESYYCTLIKGRKLYRWPVLNTTSVSRKRSLYDCDRRISQKLAKTYWWPRAQFKKASWNKYGDLVN